MQRAIKKNKFNLDDVSLIDFYRKYLGAVRKKDGIAIRKHVRMPAVIFKNEVLQEQVENKSERLTLR